MALIFRKPSTRTRVSFEVGVYELGGHPLVLGAGEMQLSRGETVEDTGRVLSRYVHGVVIRTYAQAEVQALADAATVPVINALTDAEHPCQILADLLTLEEEFGHLSGLTVAYVGDGNNVAHSLLWAGARLGFRVVVASPPGYRPDPTVQARAAKAARTAGGEVRVVEDPEEAVRGADAVYTDTWTSMGQEHEAEERRRALRPYQVTAALMSLAAPRAVFLHCLPAHRGEEVAGEVLDGPASRVLQQAENRLHAQKALMALVMG